MEHGKKCVCVCEKERERLDEIFSRLPCRSWRNNFNAHVQYSTIFSRSHPPFRWYLYAGGGGVLLLFIVGNWLIIIFFKFSEIVAEKIILNHCWVDEKAGLWTAYFNQNSNNAKSKQEYKPILLVQCQDVISLVVSVPLSDAKLSEYLLCLQHSCTFNCINL